MVFRSDWARLPRLQRRQLGHLCGLLHCRLPRPLLLPGHPQQRLRLPSGPQFGKLAFRRSSGRMKKLEGCRAWRRSRRAGRPEAVQTLGGRCSVGAHFSRAPARLFQPDGGGAAPRENRTTRRSSLQFYHERGAGAPIENPWRAMLRRRPLFPRASAALSAGWARRCAPRKSDDTASGS